MCFYKILTEKPIETICQNFSTVHNWWNKTGGFFFMMKLFTIIYKSSMEIYFAFVILFIRKANVLDLRISMINQFWTNNADTIAFVQLKREIDDPSNLLETERYFYRTVWCYVRDWTHYVTLDILWRFTANEKCIYIKRNTNFPLVLSFPQA